MILMKNWIEKYFKANDIYTGFFFFLNISVCSFTTTSSCLMCTSCHIQQDRQFGLSEAPPHKYIKNGIQVFHSDRIILSHYYFRYFFNLHFFLFLILLQRDKKELKWTLTIQILRSTLLIIPYNLSW